MLLEDKQRLFSTMSVRQTCWQHRWLCSGTVYISRCRRSCWVTRSINVTSNWFWDRLCILQPLIFSYRLCTYGGNFNYSEYLTESAVTKFNAKQSRAPTSCWQYVRAKLLMYVCLSWVLFSVLHFFCSLCLWSLPSGPIVWFTHLSNL